MAQEDSLKFPGLKWRKRKGTRVPYWFPPTADRRDGFPVTSANLSELADNLPALSARCLHLNAQVLMWRRNRITTAAGASSYDGTWGAAIEVWLTDPDSPFHNVKPGGRHPYLIYAAKLKRHIGEVAIRDTDGRDIKKWFKIWSSDGKHNPAARMALTVLKNAVKFGVWCRDRDCMEFKAIIDELEFPGNKPRDVAIGAAEVALVRAAAHDAGAPLRALAYALQYETTLRQYDVWGQWVPLSDSRASTVIDGNEKWIGPHWHQIDENMIFRTIHGKTEGWTDARGVYDLSICPMVCEEIARIPAEKRQGPLIVDETTGLPYRYDDLKDRGWKPDFKAAGLPANIWNRDMRASGNTEASKGRANKDDRARVSGHSQKINAQVYDRDAVEAHRRVMKARMTVRNGNKT